MDVLRRGNLGALGLPLLLLAAGGVARARLSRKTVAYSWHGVQLAHPTGWTVAERSADPAEGDSVVLIDLLGPGRIKPRVTMRISPLPATPAVGEETTAPTGEPAEPEENPATPASPTTDAPPVEQKGSGGADWPAATAATLSNRLPLYYVMAEQPVHIGDLAATRIDSAFAFTPPRPPGRKAGGGRKGDIPVVMRAIDLVLLRGHDALSVQAAAPIEDFETQRPILEAIVASLRIDAEPAEPAGPPTPPTAEVSVPAGADEHGATAAVTVSGQVVDAESGLPVPGAIVLFLSPGTSVADVDDDNLARVAYTTGMADSGGRFASNRALGRSARYGVMVVADGYSWIGNDDGVSVETETPPRLDMGTVRLRRR